MSDGTMATSGPGMPWPVGWRLRHDPKAPRDSGMGPSDQPTIDNIPPMLPENPPTLTGTGSPGCQIWIALDPPGSSHQAMVDDNGNWSFTFPVELPPGDYCVDVRQRCAFPGEWSEPLHKCFTAPSVNQTVDFEASHLRYDGTNLAGQGHWGIRGTLAYKINGKWVYGVLRRVVRDDGSGSPSEP